MKFTLRHIHRNSATDRTHPATRTGAAILSALLLATVTVPTVAALSAPSNYEISAETPAEAPAEAAEMTIPATLVSNRGILSPADPESMAVGMVESFTLRNPHETPRDTADSMENPTVTPNGSHETEDTPPHEESPAVDIFDPTLPLTLYNFQQFQIVHIFFSVLLSNHIFLYIHPYYFSQ